MSVPHENLVRCLLIDHGLEETARIVQHMGFPDLDLDYARPLRQKLLAARPLIFSPRRRETAQWLKQRRLFELWTRSPDAKEALSILGTETLRTAMEILLMSGLPTPEVSGHLLYLFGKLVSPHVIGLYAHYFWNRDLMNPATWNMFLTDERGDEAYPNARSLMHVYQSDPAVALWKLGIVPKLSEKKVLEKIWQDAYMRWLEVNAEANTKISADKAQSWATIMFKAMELSQKSGSAVQNAMDEMYDMSLQLKAMNVRSIDDLEIAQSSNVRQLKS